MVEGQARPALRIHKEPTMLMKNALGACIAALFVTACGGMPTEEEVADSSPVSQEQGVEKSWRPCTGRESFVRYFYSDAAMSSTVGRHECTCNGTTYVTGTTSQYYEHSGFRTCPR
ncbi:hypothetical protein D7V88_30320 [Corallococcus terminator]|uniref:Uncharacterized protein n=2 Tax=Corallococcus terminator TaxID=2316733 RepID=A0A3A8I636_9BACT|nr:hypothetical protein D7V88_30320 [Corallococcus terminator]